MITLPNNRIGYYCPLTYNPVDYVIDVLAIVPGQERDRRRRVKVRDDGGGEITFNSTGILVNCSNLISNYK